jgi:catechol 2,3-dioxygenase-like lactoylglutathione lyase family enzyme
MAQSVRGLDHAAHAVRDLDAAAQFYRQLGFSVGARNRHPWGTHNHIIQLPGFFIELLTLAEPEKLGNDGFSTMFAKFANDFAKRHDGFALLILDSQNAGADVSAFKTAGIAASDIMRFEREAKKPDGKMVKVGFSLAFAQDTHAPDIHFCTCQQHFPENFWNPEFQKHANGAKSVNGIVLVAERPAEHRDFLLAYSGAPSADEYADGLRIELPRGAIDVVTPVAFTQQYGLATPTTENGARLAALRFGVADTAPIKSCLHASAIRLATGGALPAPEPDVAVFNPDSGAVCVPVLGAALVFEASASSRKSLSPT